MTLDTTQHQAIMVLARRAVIGVAAARLNGNEADAALVISGYHTEAEAHGARPSTAWALLFSASMVAFTDAISDIADLRRQSSAAELTDFALHREQTT